MITTFQFVVFSPLSYPKTRVRTAPVLLDCSSPRTPRMHHARRFSLRPSPSSCVQHCTGGDHHRNDNTTQRPNVSVPRTRVPASASASAPPLPPPPIPPASLVQVAEDPNHILLEEARAGRVAGLEAALEEFGTSADVNRALDPSFLSPLCLACRGGHEEAALFLLRRAGADPNNASGEKAAAAAAAAAPAVQGYYGDGADGDGFFGGSGGIGGGGAPSTPLALAVDGGLRLAVEELLARGARVDARRAVDAWTPLHLCAAQGNALMMEVLLEAPLADAGARTSRQETPLSVASFHGHLSIVDMLLGGGGVDDEKVADVGGIIKETAGGGGLGTSAVLVATEEDAAAAAAVVVGSGRYGSSHGRSGPRRHAEGRTWAGRTPLHRAAAQGHTEVVLRLLAHGVDASPTDSRGATPLHLSAGRGHLGAARALVQEGRASTLVATEEGDTVLHAAAGSAAASGRTAGRVVHLLLRSGAEVDARNRLGSTGSTSRRNFER